MVINAELYENEIYDVIITLLFGHLLLFDRKWVLNLHDGQKSFLNLGV